MRLKATLTACLTVSSLIAIAAGPPGVEVGSAAPELKLPAADGTSRSLAAADGTTVLIFYRGLW